MTNVQVHIIGDLFPLNIGKLISTFNNSKILKIKEAPIGVNRFEIPSPILTTTFVRERYCSKLHSPDETLNLILTRERLEGDFFTHKIDNNFALITTHDSEILYSHDGITLEMHLARFFYGISVMFEMQRRLPQEDFSLIHEEICGCLFDFARSKKDITRFFYGPILTNEVKSKLDSVVGLDKHYITNLEKEITKLKIAKFIQIKNKYKNSPIVFFLTIICIPLVVSLLANLLYEYLKAHL